MAIRDVLKMGDPRLLAISEPVAAFGTPELEGLLADMRDTMQHLNGAGLAAPQIGVLARVVIFGVEANPRYPQAEPVPFTVLINPELTPLGEDMEEGWEGCLSVPGMRGPGAPVSAFALWRAGLRWPSHRTHGERFSCTRRTTRGGPPRWHPVSAAYPGFDPVRLQRRPVSRPESHRRLIGVRRSARGSRQGLREALVMHCVTCMQTLGFITQPKPHSGRPLT